jgi:hypothetical protein
MFPSTLERVLVNTADNGNEEIRHRTGQNFARCASRKLPAIERRLDEPKQEWNIERLLEANPCSVCLVGFTPGAPVDRKPFALPAAVAGFFVHHAAQGWCPPMHVFKSLCARTASEIDYDRYALKAVHSDFRDVSSKERRNAAGAHLALKATRA